MKTRIIVAIIIGSIIISISIGYMTFLINEPKTAADCRIKFGKGTSEMFDCLEKIKNNILTQSPSKVGPLNLYHKQCADLFDSSLESWVPPSSDYIPPTLAHIILGTPEFEEFRASDCRLSIFDWAYLSENEDFIWNSNMQWPEFTQWPESESTIKDKADKLGINNIMEAVDSEELSDYEKFEYIKLRYEEDGPVTEPSLNLRIKDLSRELEYGEQPTFTLIETGYGHPCASPKLEIFLVKGDRALYSISEDEPIYVGKIVYPCPFGLKDSAILHYRTEKDYPNFPSCEFEGTHIIVGDSGTERGVLDEYYCKPK